MSDRSGRIFVGGVWRPAGDGGLRDTLDPSTGKPITSVAEATGQDVDEAVEAARAAFDRSEWPAMPPAARARVLWRIADLIEEHGDELAALETRDQGQPIGVATQVSLGMTAEHFRYFAGWCTKIEGTVSPVSVPDMMHYTRREPVGVCALITPWNFPMMIASWKIAPALATGNTMVVKPAEQTPLTTIRLVELIEEAGVPAGVVNLLTGGPEVGQALVDHPLVDKVSFTGSTAVGRSIVRSSADNLKRVTLELGGKAPSIIARDADIDAAVAGNLQGALLNSGQVCAAYTRFYVDAARHDEFAEKLSAAASSLALGPGIDPSSQLGPLVSEEHLARVTSYVDSGTQQGAELRTGGTRADGPLADGYFFSPTVFAGVRDDMTIAREEIFGPVLSVFPYDEPDEAVARANDTPYGLAATVWTSDLKTAHRTAAALRAGTVWINALPLLDAAAPWGGYKSSGWGREMGPETINAYTESKGVWVNLS